MKRQRTLTGVFLASLFLALLLAPPVSSLHRDYVSYYSGTTTELRGAVEDELGGLSLPLSLEVHSTPRFYSASSTPGGGFSFGLGELEPGTHEFWLRMPAPGYQLRLSRENLEVYREGENLVVHGFLTAGQVRDLGVLGLLFDPFDLSLLEPSGFSPASLTTVAVPFQAPRGVVTGYREERVPSGWRWEEYAQVGTRTETQNLEAWGWVPTGRTYTVYGIGPLSTSPPSLPAGYRWTKVSGDWYSATYREEKNEAEVLRAEGWTVAPQYGQVWYADVYHWEKAGTTTEYGPWTRTASVIVKSGLSSPPSDAGKEEILSETEKHVWWVNSCPQTRYYYGYDIYTRSSTTVPVYGPWTKTASVIVRSNASSVPSDICNGREVITSGTEKAVWWVSPQTTYTTYYVYNWYLYKNGKYDSGGTETFDTYKGSCFVTEWCSGTLRKTSYRKEYYYSCSYTQAQTTYTYGYDCYTRTLTYTKEYGPWTRTGGSQSNLEASLPPGIYDGKEEVVSDTEKHVWYVRTFVWTFYDYGYDIYTRTTRLVDLYDWVFKGRQSFSSQPMSSGEWQYRNLTPSQEVVGYTATRNVPVYGWVERRSESPPAPGTTYYEGGMKGYVNYVNSELKIVLSNFENADPQPGWIRDLERTYTVVREPVYAEENATGYRYYQVPSWSPASTQVRLSPKNGYSGPAYLEASGDAPFSLERSEVRGTSSVGLTVSPSSASRHQVTVRAYAVDLRGSRRQVGERTYTVEVEKAESKLVGEVVPENEVSTISMRVEAQRVSSELSVPYMQISGIYDGSFGGGPITQSYTIDVYKPIAYMDENGKEHFVSSPDEVPPGTPYYTNYVDPWRRAQAREQAGDWRQILQSLSKG